MGEQHISLAMGDKSLPVLGSGIAETNQDDFFFSIEQFLKYPNNTFSLLDESAGMKGSSEVEMKHSETIVTCSAWRIVGAGAH